MYIYLYVYTHVFRRIYTHVYTLLCMNMNIHTRISAEFRSQIVNKWNQANAKGSGDRSRRIQLTVRSKFKFQELVSKFPLMTNIISQIKVTC